MGLGNMRRLAVLACGVLSTTAASVAEPYPDPFKGLSAYDGGMARKGWLFNQEDEDAWKRRLAESPPQVERVFVLWRPERIRKQDFSVVVCFSRTVEEPEKDKVGLLTVSFAEGKPEDLGSIGRWTNLYGSDVEGRCFEQTESYIHRGFKFVVNEEAERKFRPENVKAVTIKRTVEKTYEKPREESEEYANLRGWVSPSRDRQVKGQYRFDEVPLTPDFVKGRMHGEARHYATFCAGVSTSAEVTVPDGGDDGEYAQGFAEGWELGKDMLQRSDCGFAVKAFPIAQANVGDVLSGEAAAKR